jgi:HSP20 family protein
MVNPVPWKKEKNGFGALTTRGGDHPLAQIREEFDALFDRFFGRLPAAFADFGTHLWGLDMDDTGNEVVVRAEAPGFEAGDFDVHVGNNVLTIRAERKQEAGGDKEAAYSERRSFQRSVTLPAGIDADRVEARYRNGVLELRLPKTEDAQRKRIEVKA